MILLAEEEDVIVSRSEPGKVEVECAKDEEQATTNGAIEQGRDANQSDTHVGASVREATDTKERTPHNPSTHDSVLHPAHF